jgi:Tfp pilus assembly major pilin PilA
MASKIGELYWKITGDTTDINKDISTTDTKVTGLRSTFSGLSTFLSGAFVVAAVAGIAKVSKELISAASDAEETRNKFNVVFGDLQDEAEDAATNLSDNFGLSQQAAENLLSSTGDLLTGFGLTSDAALDLSTKTNTLAADLASFTNAQGGAEAVSAALTSAYTGERDSLKSYGIVISEAMVQAQLLEDAQNGLTFATEAEAEAYATLTLATTQSANAIGDFARSSDSYANQSRIAAAAVADLKVELGERLLPITTKSISIFGDLAGKLADFVSERNKLIEAKDAFEDGNETLEQRLLLLQEDLAREKSYAETQAETASLSAGYASDAQDRTEQRIASITAEISAISQQMAAEKSLAEAQASGDEEAAAQAEAELARQQELADYLAEVAEAYADTEAGQIEILQQKIDKWESYAETAVNTAPQVQAVLNDLYSEMESIVGATEEATDATIDFSSTGQNLIGEALSPMTDAAKEMWRTYGEGVANARTETQQLSADVIDFEALATSAAESLLSGYEDLGEALFNGEDAATAFASTMLDTISELLSALGAQLAAQAAANLLLGNVPLSVAGGVASAAAYTAAGVVSAAADSFEEGGIVPGYSYSGDNVIANVNSGEAILTQEQQQRLLSIADGTSSGGTSNITINNLISTGKESEMRASAKMLYPYIEEERVRRGE